MGQLLMKYAERSDTYMLMPDVTAILNDPEVGGGVPFQVKRTTNTRVMGSVRQSETIINATGNIQPQDKSSQSSTAEDLLNEGIVVYSKFTFSTGENDGGMTFLGPDEILWDGKTWRVTFVDNWSKWGYTRASATRVR